MLQNIGAQNVIEAALQGRQSGVEVASHELKRIIVSGARQIDPGDGVSAPGQDLRQIPLGTADVQHPAARSCSRKLLQQQDMTAVRALLELISGWYRRARHGHRTIISASCAYYRPSDCLTVVNKSPGRRVL